MTSSPSFRVIALIGTLAIAACSQEAQPVAPSPAPVAEPAPAATPTAPTPSAPAWMIGFDGVNGIAYGSTPEALAAVLPANRVVDEPLEPGGCYYMHPQPPVPDYSGVAFMIDEGRFARVDVDTTDLMAPGGGAVGKTLEYLRAAYPQREEQPHKYEDGLYFIVPSPLGGDERLIFETDAEGRVSRWRMGLPPAVHYVEGCA
jgi:hypothetical protein